MKTIYYILVCLSLFIAKSAQGYAQEETTQRNEHFVGIAFGAQLNTSSYNSTIGEIIFQGKKRAFMSITMLNYQYFFHKHWGVFLSIRPNDSTPYSEEALMNKMEKETSPYYYIYNGSMEQDEIMHSTFSLGPTYRQDIGSWSFRAYLSPGLARYMHPTAIKYLRKEKGNNQAEQVKVTVGNDKETQYGFCLSPGIYISKAVSRIVYLTADLSYTLHTREFTARYQRSNVYTNEVLEQYSVKEAPGNHLSLTAGVSFRLVKKKKKSSKNYFPNELLPLR